jgi:hypothetical protein
MLFFGVDDERAESNNSARACGKGYPREQCALTMSLGVRERLDCALRDAALDC